MKNSLKVFNKLNTLITRMRDAGYYNSEKLKIKIFK